jgi:diadenosine tetraphosphate (Ap4A) HIT family hydrolase
MNNLLDCEFCSEFSLSKQSRFKNLYGEVLPSRIIDETDNFIVLPTMGQLYKGSLLILSKSHIESFSCLTTRLIPELEALIQNFQEKVGLFGHPFIFEHGANSASGGGCGIYHAHVHIVPLPKPVNWNEILELPGQEVTSLGLAWEMLKDSDEYILVKDGFSTVWLSKLKENQCHRLSSQYCRRRIAEFFQLSQPWDWHQYNYIEDSLISTFDFFKADALVSK